MPSPKNENIIEYLVVENKSGRTFTADTDSRWGGFIAPAAAENPAKTDAGLRVVLFASWDFGYLLLETMKAFENKFPEQLNIVGLVTDNPLNPDARISAKKRVWNLLDTPTRVMDETLLIESGLGHGVPVYNGEIKVDSFRGILKRWNADAILVCVFGQVIDSFVIDCPRFGIYNFHPSDLSKNQGAGPAPYDDLAQRCASTGVWSVHQVSTELDGGRVVGTSPPVNVLDTAGQLPADPVVVYHKLGEVLAPMGILLVEELTRRFHEGTPGWVESVDFENLISADVRTKIRRPVMGDPWTDIASIPDGYIAK